METLQNITQLALAACGFLMLLTSVKPDKTMENWERADGNNPFFVRIVIALHGVAMLAGAHFIGYCICSNVGAFWDYMPSFLQHFFRPHGYGQCCQ